MQRRACEKCKFVMMDLKGSNWVCEKCGYSYPDTTYTPKPVNTQVIKVIEPKVAQNPPKPINNDFDDTLKKLKEKLN